MAGEPAGPTGADRAREALRERRAAQANDDGSVDAAQVQGQSTFLPDPDAAEDRAYAEAEAIASSVVPDEEDQPTYPFDVAIDGEPAIVTAHECEPAPDQVWFCRHCGADLANPDDPGMTAWPDDTPVLDTDLIRPPWRTVLGPDEPIRITLPGVYQLDAQEYHDPKITGDWLSNTDAKQLTGEGVPAQYRYDKDHGVHEEKDVWELGKAIHAKILGKGDEVVYRPRVDPADPGSEWNDWRKNAAKAWRSKQQAAGRIVLTPDQRTIVDGMAAAIFNHPEAERLLFQPGRPEVCLFWVDQATGVKRRCMVDYLPDAPNAVGLLEIVDVKSADSAAPTEKMSRKIYDHGYHRQQATIVDAVIALGLAVDAEVTFLFQAKRAPYLVTPVVLDSNAQRIGGIQNREALEVYARCVETDTWPGFSDRPVTMGLPYFIEREYEDQIEVTD